MKFTNMAKASLLQSLLMLAFLNGLWAQSNIQNPYSRFGLGSLDQQGSVAHFGMGGITTALTDPHVINRSNPASYSFLDVTTLQVAGKGNSSSYTTNAGSNSFRGGQISEFMLAFKRDRSKWGFAMGLTPYSTVGYGFSARQVINDSLSAVNSYRGTGGINRASIGLSRMVEFRKKYYHKDDDPKNDSISPKLHQLSFGANVNFLFGNVLDTSKVIYDKINIYNTRSIRSNNYAGFLFDVGMVYQVPLRLRFDDKRISGGTFLQTGVRYTAQSSIRSSMTQTDQLFLRSSGVEYAIDTTFFSSGIINRISMPQAIAIGVTLREVQKKMGTLLFAIDYKIQDWNGVSALVGQPVNESRMLDKSATLSAGIEYRPSTGKSSNLPHRIYYRMGVRDTDTYLKINGVTIRQQAVSAGLSFPILKSESRLHIGVERGVGGTLDQNLVQEKFWNFQVGFTFTPRELWFYQPKFD